jgi:predicted Zn-dependent peptidase
LPSGVTLLHELKPGASMESYTVAVRAGKKHGDVPGQAEAVANMLVRETGNYSKVELQNYLDENGFDLEATTLPDASYITLQAPAGSAAKAMALLAEVLTNPGFSDDEWASQKSEMLAQIDSALDQPRVVVDELTTATVFAGSAYGRSIADDRAALPALDTDDLRAFYDNHYKAGSIAVAYTGDAGEAEVADGLAPLASLKGRTASSEPIELAAIQGVSHAAQAMEGRQQTNLNVVWHAPDIETDDFIRWQLAARAIGGDLAGRLWKLRQDEGLAYSVWLYNQPNVEQPITMVYMATAAEKRTDAIAAIHREIDRLQSGLTQDELDRVKVSYLANLNRQDRTSARRSSRHAEWWVAGFDANFRARLNNVVSNATLDDVNQVVRDVLQPRDYVFVEAGAVGDTGD